MSITVPVIDWLLRGDPAIRWQVLRDLVGSTRSVWQAERRLVAESGWGARLLTRQDRGGTWSARLYSPKWTSTTYTMMLLRRLGLPPRHRAALRACRILVDRGLRDDGGINFSTSDKRSETCITGMVLSLASHFGMNDSRLETVVNHVFEQQMADGGWNCQRRRGAVHSSFHTTISVLEGLRAYVERRRSLAAEATDAETRGREFLLNHKLYRSHRTGKVVHSVMTRFSFPPRWHYDVLRALDYFQASGAERDERLSDAMSLLEKKQDEKGRWPLQNRHNGKTFFKMEAIGKPSRWNTLRALRVLGWWTRGA